MIYSILKINSIGRWRSRWGRSVVLEHRIQKRLQRKKTSKITTGSWPSAVCGHGKSTSPCRREWPMHLKSAWAWGSSNAAFINPSGDGVERGPSSLDCRAFLVQGVLRWLWPSTPANLYSSFCNNFWLIVFETGHFPQTGGSHRLGLENKHKNLKGLSKARCDMRMPFLRKCMGTPDLRRTTARDSVDQGCLSQAVLMIYHFIVHDKWLLMYKRLSLTSECDILITSLLNRLAACWQQFRPKPYGMPLPRFNLCLEALQSLAQWATTECAGNGGCWQSDCRMTSGIWARTARKHSPYYTWLLLSLIRRV